MSIYIIVAVLLCAELLIAKINIRYALSIFLLILLLIPGVIKFNVGINLNSFNLAAFIFILFAVINRKKDVSLPKLRKVLWVYAVYVCITSFLTFGIVVGFSRYLQNMLLFILEYLGIPFALTFVRLDEKALKCFNVTLVAAGTIIIAYGLMNYITGFNPYMAYVALTADMTVDMSNIFQEEERGLIMGRISSTFIHPLQLGQCALILFVYSFYHLRHKMRLVFYLPFALGLALMCVLCGSRSAIFPLSIPLLFYILYAKPSKKVKYIVLACLLVAFCYPMLPRKARVTIEGLTFVWNQNASNRAAISGSSVEGRWEQIESAFRVINDNVLFGKGEGYVRDYGYRHSSVLLGYESIILKYLVDGGVVGLLAFCLFYFSSYRMLLRQACCRQDKASVHSLCLSFFANIVLTGISYSFFAIYMIFYFATYYSLTNKKTIE